MPCNDVTLDVLKLDKFTKFKAEQEENIVSIVLTLDVLKWDKSKKVNDLQE